MVRKYQYGNPITTGGSGYFPLFNQETIESIGYRYITGGLPISIVRQRLYNNVYPHSYNDIISRFRNAVVNNKKDRRIGVRGNNENNYLNETRDPIFAEYLNIPEKDRHKSNYKLVESKYLPTIGKSGSKYYASPTVTAWREKGKHLGTISHLISSIYNSSYSRKYDKPLNIGESRVGVPLSKDLGKHTISRGYDDKGEYVSYYDKWDLSPLGGSAGERDDSKGIGTPVSFYDRIYLDDYYGVKTPTHSTYLPEVVVKGRKHKFGGITKAANARKWKHEDGGLLELLPIYGTYKDFERFKENPNWRTGASLGLSALGDLALFTGAGAIVKGITTANKARRAYRAANSAANLARQKVWNAGSKLNRETLAVNSLTLMNAPTKTIMLRQALKNLAKQNYTAALNEDNKAFNALLKAGKNPNINFKGSDYIPFMVTNPSFHAASTAIKKNGGTLKALYDTPLNLPNDIKKHLEGAKLTFGLKLGNFAKSDLGKSVISNGLSFLSDKLSDKLLNKSASSNLEIALVAQEKELPTIDPMQVAQMIEIAKNQYADPDNPNANGGDIFNSYIKNQITAPILARQLEEHKKRLAAIDLLKNQAKSSAVGTFFNTLAQGGIEYLLNKYGTTEKADS